MLNHCVRIMNFNLVVRTKIQYAQKTLVSAEVPCLVKNR